MQIGIELSLLKNGAQYKSETLCELSNSLCDV